MSIIPHFEKFKGKLIEDVADDMNALAKEYGYSVNYLDDSFPKNIDVDSYRLNAVLVKDENECQRVDHFNIG